MKRKRKDPQGDGMIWRDGQWKVLSINELPVRKGDLLRSRGHRAIFLVNEVSARDRRGNWVWYVEDFGILSK